MPTHFIGVFSCRLYKFHGVNSFCLVERMVEIWNAPPKSANEKSPDWCADVSALQKRFSVIKPDEQSFWEEEVENTIFAKRNIFAPKEFMFFL